MADELEVVLNRGGFLLKGITFSNQDPPESLSDNGESINVAGMKWFPEDDIIPLDIKDMNFPKKIRGQTPRRQISQEETVFLKSKIFDITGKITPLTTAMKLNWIDMKLEIYINYYIN